MLKLSRFLNFTTFLEIFSKNSLTLQYICQILLKVFQNYFKFSKNYHIDSNISFIICTQNSLS